MRNLWLIGLIACGQSGPPQPPREPPRPPAPRETISEPDPTAAWPSDVTSLTESVDAFRDRESCEAGLREKLPVEIAELLDDLHYEGVVADACIGLEAVREKNPQTCGELSTNVLRNGCLLRVAVVAAEPDWCPEGAGVEGRDPLCLAWAQRKRSACLGAAPWERDRCRALLDNDAERCRADRNSARCVGLVRRLGPVASDGVEAGARFGDAELELRIIGQDDQERLKVDASAAVARGVHIRADECIHRISLGRQNSGLLSRNELRLELGPTGVGGSIAVDGLQRELEARIAPNPIELSRGAAIESEISGRLRVGGEDLRVEGTIRTFVRDKDPLPEDCASTP